MKRELTPARRRLGVRTALVALAWAGGLGGGGVEAQTVLQTWTPKPAFDSIPDLDGDGFRELLVGQHRFSRAASYGGRVYGLSGRKRSFLYRHEPTEDDTHLGYSLAAVGDVSGDGFPDFLATSFVGVFGFDGADGSVLFQLPGLPSAMAGLEDVNGDGVGDFLLVEGGAFVYLGGSFELFYDVYAPSPGADPLGFSTGVGMRDVDADGIPDFAVAQPGDPTSSTPIGAVFVYSGARGELIWSLCGEGHGDFFGRALAALDDVNGDGVGDLVVGAHDCCDDVGAGSGRGRIYFFDGPSGALIERVDPPSRNYDFGRALARAGDVNGNGVGDVLVYARQPVMPSSRGRVLDGRTRREIHEIPATYARGFVRGGVDWNGDDFPDFLAADPRDAWLDLYSGAAVGVAAVGEPCGSGVDPRPRIGATGVLVIGRDYPIHLSRVLPGRSVLLVLGRPGPLLASDCPHLLQPLTIHPALTGEVSPGHGAATVDVAIPNDPSLVGTPFHAQWVIPRPVNEGGGIAATRVLEITPQDSTTASALSEPADTRLLGARPR